ncbi:MAG: hypothetical protein A2035_03350 [Nitrospirae bacterium GWA2_42_11]|nr:MAG: hypothetical protein A2035_03350 [Nitrospirae bacterium GWA2_42_11]
MQSGEDRTVWLTPPPAVRVKVIQGKASQDEMRFTDAFKIGRDKSCQLQLKDSSMSRFHAEVSFDGEKWIVSDLESTNGTFLDGSRIQQASLPDESRLEFGIGGPVLLLTIEGTKIKEEKKVEPPTSSTSTLTEGHGSVTQVMDRYFSKTQPEQAGEHTMMIRHAFERVHKKQSKKYLIIIGLVAFLLVCAGGVVAYQQMKIRNLRSLAGDIFYNMKILELQVAVMENMVMASADPKQRAELATKRARINDMEKNYEKFLGELGVYSKNMSEDEKLILRVARLFGECEVNMPKGFMKEVQSYIKKWQSSDRLNKAIHRAEVGGYGPPIAREMLAYHLPSQFFYLALQESSFNDRAVGPPTRFGIAKGIWQFIPPTAVQYGLSTGPLLEVAQYDPRDERHDFEKSTQAAARYLNDIYNTEAQASGLLVIASYNWGENNIRSIINKMPMNPRERNFWKLLEHYKIPKETYDYVFYIFSAAVIGEDPHHFGFDYKNPISD